MKHLVVGSSGLVGSHIMRTLGSTGSDHAGTYFSKNRQGCLRLDIRDVDAIDEIFSDFKPEVVYLPAKSGGVDYCELHPSETYATNVGAVRNVSQACNKYHAKLVFFSSDYIFDGNNGPYEEDDLPNPINQYGREKLIAEHHISLFVDDYLIIRTTVVYGLEEQRKNFIYSLLTSFEKGQEVHVPSDQIGTPTYASNLADIVVDLAIRDARGVFNVVGPDLMSRYAFAQACADSFGYSRKLVVPITTDRLNQPAKRPLCAGMSIDKIRSITSCPIIGVSQGLTDLRGKLFHTHE